MQILKRSRLILTDSAFKLSHQETQFLKFLANKSNHHKQITVKQLDWFLQIDKRYIDTNIKLLDKTLNRIKMYLDLNQSA